MISLRKVFLDELPKWNKGGSINWGKSIGHKVKFIYEDIEGEVEIINYYKNKNYYYLDVKYNDSIISMSVNHFSKCQLGNLLNKRNYNYVYNIGDIISNKVSQIEILEQIRTKNKISFNKKAYKYKCLNCGNIDTISESNLINNYGCNVCCISPKKVLRGYNDIATTNPELIKYFANIEDVYKYSYSSSKSVNMKCPNCSYMKSMLISNLYKYSFSCKKCGDKISYPNKFAFNLLEQLNIDFEYEYNPDWIKPRRYDFYFEVNNKQYILEMDGSLGHGNDNPLNGQTAEDSKAIDDYKDKLAKEHNIEVIRIDCLKSNLKYIKKNILTSKLVDLFDLNSIEWDEIEKYACSNLVEKVSILWMDGIKDIKEISNIIKIAKNTVIKYLNQGTKLKWCNYNGKEIMKNNGIKVSKIRSIPIIQLSLTGKYIAEFESAAEAGRQLNIGDRNINNCCRGKKNSAGRFKWMYKEDYDKYIKQQNKSA